MQTVIIGDKEYKLKDLTFGMALELYDFISTLPMKDAYKHAKEWCLDAQDKKELLKEAQNRSKEIRSILQKQEGVEEVMKEFQARLDVIQYMVNSRIVGDTININEFSTDDIDDLLKVIFDTDDDTEKKTELKEGQIQE